MKACTPDIMHADQACGISGRHIYDSIALSRDIIDYAKRDGIPMSIINVDQEKAFDINLWFNYYYIDYSLVYNKT